MYYTLNGTNVNMTGCTFFQNTADKMLNFVKSSNVYLKDIGIYQTTVSSQLISLIEVPNVVMENVLILNNSLGGDCIRISKSNAVILNSQIQGEIRVASSTAKIVNSTFGFMTCGDSTVELIQVSYDELKDSGSCNWKISGEQCTINM